MKRYQWTIGLTGVLLMLAGLTETTDSIVSYVTKIVDDISWYDVWRPAFDPAPMNTFTYRPLTIALVKLQLLITGRDPFWMTAIHALTIPWLGFAVHRFLRTHGMAHVATHTAISTMALPSLLFSGWISVESDGLGAIFVCEAAYLLQRWRASNSSLHRLLFFLAAFGAATTKESSAAAFFGYLLANAWVYRRGNIRFNASLLLGYGIALGCLVIPLLLARPPKPHDFHVTSTLFDPARIGYMVLHNLTQLFYILGSAGAVLMFFHKRVSLPLMLAAVLILISAPPMRVYNHYESVVIDALFYVEGCSFIMIAGLIWIGLSSIKPHKVLVGTAFFLMATLIFAPILALQSRPDVSARLYAPIAPILHGLAWSGALALIHNEWSRWKRGVAWGIVACFGLMPLTGASNATQSFRARMAIEGQAKRTLAKQLKDPRAQCPVVIATNRDHELATEELADSWTECSELFIPNRIRLDPAPVELGSWRLQGHRYSLKTTDLSGLQASLLNGEKPTRCAFLYVQTPRAMMDTSNFRLYAGDFSWAYGNLPEFDENLYRQQVEIQYREVTALEILFRQAGAKETMNESTFDVFPINPNEAVQRLISGRDIVEAYAYEGRVFSFEHCARAEQ